MKPRQVVYFIANLKSAEEVSHVQTWSQVLGVGDQVLHGLHHFSHSQVLQDAFAHTDDFADLLQCQSKKYIYKKDALVTLCCSTRGHSDPPSPPSPPLRVPPPLHTLVTPPPDIPASFVSPQTAGVTTGGRAVVPELRWKMWRHHND